MATLPSLSLTKQNNKEDSKKEREMISSLPKAKGWVSHYLYQYQGFWHMFPTVEAIISAQQNFKSKPGDVLVATHPKCGTTWLKSLVFAIKNRAIYPNSSCTAHPLLTINPHALVPNIESPFSQHYALVNVENLPSPRLLGTHMPYISLPESIISSGCPVVYLCRDPKDLFISMWHFFDKIVDKESPLIPMHEAFELFCCGVSFIGPYWDHVLGYYKASLECPKRVLFLKYEDMQSDALNHLKKLAEFLGYPFSLEEEAKGVIQEIIQLCSFQNMSKLKVTTEGKLFGQVKNDMFYRKGEVGDAKNYLTAEMMERLDRISKQKFQGFDIGY